MGDEEWRQVVGFEGLYSVSNHGGVRSEPHVTTTISGRTRRCQGIRLSPAIVTGYFSVTLSKGGRLFPRMIHRLVAEAFIGERPPKHHINHLDGVKTNNHPSNLEYVTPADNVRHASMMGLRPSGDNHWTRRTPDKVARGDKSWSRLHMDRMARGEGSSNAKLTSDMVVAIRAQRSAGASLGVIGRLFGIHKSTVAQICERRSWRHV